MPMPTVSDYAQAKYERLKRENKLNNVSMAQAYMPPENTSADPLAQPVRRTGRGVGEEQEVLKAARDVFGKGFDDSETGRCDKCDAILNEEGKCPKCSKKSINKTEDDDMDEEEEAVAQDKAY